MSRRKLARFALSATMHVAHSVDDVRYGSTPSSRPRKKLPLKMLTASATADHAMAVIAIAGPGDHFGRPPVLHRVSAARPKRASVATGGGRHA